MHGLPTWCKFQLLIHKTQRKALTRSSGYKTEHFWLEYPHREMTWELKTYYLMQAAYWLQQTILLAAKIEKPRKDFKELVAHVGISDEEDMQGFANDEIAHCHPLVGWMELQHLCRFLIRDELLGRRLTFHSLLTLVFPSLLLWMFPTSSLPYVCSSP